MSNEHEAAPVVSVDGALAGRLTEVVGTPLDDLEARARESTLAGLCDVPGWSHLADAVLARWYARDHVVIRGLPVASAPAASGSGGAGLLLASCILSTAFRTYRGAQIVKRFRMSPWTRELSHTTREGHFHTDLNTEETPPTITGIQCVDPDPGAPRYGCNRVARLDDLLAYLARAEEHDALDFLCHQQVAMVNDRRPDTWRGRIVTRDEVRIRFHPETIRAAARRHDLAVDDIERHLAVIHRSALAVSTPFWLDRGDILLVSNRRALHYRGECSVVFEDYPLKFRARAICVAHLMSEPARPFTPPDDQRA